MDICKDCEYYEADGSGEPFCLYKGDGKTCPFEAEKIEKESGAFQIVIDGSAMEEYIKRKIQGIVGQEAAEIARREMKYQMEQMVQDEYKTIVKSLTEEEVKKQVEAQVRKFMEGEITVGGSWRESARTLKREAYLGELVEKGLKDVVDNNKDSLKKEIERTCREKFERFYRKLREEVNRDVAQNFDEITRKTLTDSVVNMLMSSDTYKRLADTMGNLLPEKREGDV